MGIIARMRSQKLVIGAAAILLTTGTVLVFFAFDAHSHSVSDTIRPFVITMAPIWAGFAILIWAATRTRSRRRHDH